MYRILYNKGDEVLSAKARLGDYVSMNCPHGGTGVIVRGSDVEGDDTEKSARLFDTVQCNSCGCLGIIITASVTTFVDGFGSARVGDSTIGICDVGAKCCPHMRSGTIISGSPKTFVDGG
jgi:uncharacterized Zn-binding protein involved in type VI secretion